MNYNIEMNHRQINIVRFCANECHHQMSGEKSVARMVEAYNVAINYNKCGEGVSETMILRLAGLIEPRNTTVGGFGKYRITPVVFESGGHALSAELIQRQMELLLDNMDRLTIDEFVKRFLEIHPFEDGNGRTAAILYNYLDGMLQAPQELPRYEFV